MLPNEQRLLGFCRQSAGKLWRQSLLSHFCKHSICIVGFNINCIKFLVFLLYLLYNIFVDNVRQQAFDNICSRKFCSLERYGKHDKLNSIFLLCLCVNVSLLFHFYIGYKIRTVNIILPYIQFYTNSMISKL